MQLSEHFVLAEFEFSQLAVRRGYDNSLPELKLPNLQLLVDSVLQPLRTALGERVIIASGYRCPRLNREVAGSRNSAHMHGLAADIWVAEMSPHALTAHIATSGLPFDIVVNEFGRWTHVQVPKSGAAARCEVKTAYKLGNNHTRIAQGNLAVQENRQL